MKFLVITLCVLTTIVSANGRESDSLDIQDTLTLAYVTELDKIVVTATRRPRDAFSLARSVTVLDKKELTGKNQHSVPDALDDEIGVWIEKRTTTTSDPVVRGLSGANVLALVDGNSLTTFWGEGGFAGDDMYGKVDGESIDYVEVVRGPSSVLYGSNALGGVINFLTKKSPLSFTESGFAYGGALKGASGSASDYLMGRIESWGATKAMRYFLGATAHRSGDMRTGGDIGYITPSGGKDWSIDLNSEFKLNDKNFLSLGGQYMDRPVTFRYYRPTQSNKNTRLGLEAGYRGLHLFPASDLVKLNLYHQYKRDERYWYESTDLAVKKEEGFAWWRTFAADLQSNKTFNENNTLIAGVSYHVDLAESPDDEQFVMKTSSGNQKAAPDTKWHNVGVFLQDEWDIGNFLTLSGSFRYDYFRFIAEDDTFYTKPGDPDTSKNKAMTDPGEYSNNAFTGGAGVVFHIGDHFNIAGSWTRGFRMFPPSFGFRQTAQGVLVPNGLLDPVTADLFVISPRLKIRALDINLVGYYTKFHNFQQPIHGEYNGDTAIDYNNNGTFEPDEHVYVNTANGDAYVTGVELELDLHFGVFAKALEGLHFIGGMMYNYGRMKFPGKEEMWLRHTHPLRGLVKIRYTDPVPDPRWWVEFVADIVDKYDMIDEDRLQSDVGYLKNPQNPESGLLTSYGLPSYYIFDIRGGFNFHKYFSVTLAVENLLNDNYRTAHSRMDASGRNILVGLEMRLPKNASGK